MHVARLSKWIGTAALASVLVVAGACSRQQEGERCDTAAGVSGTDSDCADGLECVNLGTQAPVNSDICCPISATPTDPVCLLAEPSGSGGGGPGSGGGGSGGDGVGGTGGSGGGTGGMGTGGSGGAPGTAGNGGTGG